MYANNPPPQAPRSAPVLTSPNRLNVRNGSVAGPTPLRERQGEQARNRAAITEKRGKKARPKVTKAERKLQAEMSALASERAWLDGPRPLALRAQSQNAEATRTS